MGYIYKITSPSNKIYIGQSKSEISLKRRILSYKYGQCKAQPKIFNSIMKYGWNLHLFEIIEELEFNGEFNEILDSQEIFWIEKFNCVVEGLNCEIGRKYHPKSEETKKKISETKKNQTFIPWNKGLTKEDDDRLKISDETKEKMSKDRLGRKHKKKHSPENFLAEKNGMYGKKHTQEAIEKIRNAGKGNTRTKGIKLKIIKCPHCELEGGSNNMKRYHFGKCKMLNLIIA